MDILDVYVIVYLMIFWFSQLPEEQHEEHVKEVLPLRDNQLFMP